MTQSQLEGLMRRSPMQIVLEYLNGMWLSYAIQAAAWYDFATLIGDELIPTDQLARQVDVKEDWTYRLLRFLASYGLFSEIAPRTFANTELSACLRSDRPGMYSMARYMGTRRMRETWGDLEETIRTGEPAIERLFGKKLYEYFVYHPDEEEIFEGAMNSFAGIVNGAIAANYDFSSVGKVIDVGGGNGSLLRVLLQRHPTLQVVLFERPAVIVYLMEQDGDSAPFDLYAGDFFMEVPDGADIYILKEVLHNWSDEQCRLILRNCRRAMHASSRLLICEQVILPGDNQGSFAKGLDLLMGLEQQGRERTQEEFCALLASADLNMRQVIHTHSPQRIFEAVPA